MAEQTKPVAIQLHSRSRQLELEYANGERFSLSCEYLRVYSPSAEVLGHGPGQEVLQTGKLKVAITDIKPVGNYALQLVFDDGHDTGLYAFTYRYELAKIRRPNGRSTSIDWLTLAPVVIQTFRC